jgi:hypothetical protein
MLVALLKNLDKRFAEIVLHLACDKAQYAPSEENGRI